MAAPLSLGEIVFNDFEIPEHLAIGGKQRLVIHQLPGGGRVVDVMGAEDAPIQWSGIFSGQQAAERVRTLEKLRQSGERQLLTWDAWRFMVIVQNFEAELSSNRWIPYRIQLCTLSNFQRNEGDWLNSATSPVLSTALVTSAALEIAIATAGSGLSASSVGQAIGAAGHLAQFVTARAYSLFSA